MSGLTYDTYVTQLATLAVVPLVVDQSGNPTSPVTTSDTNFNLIIPAAITYAEQRILRDLDLLSTVIAATQLLAPNTSQQTIPLAIGTGFWITIQNLNAVTPNLQTDPDLGTRNPILPVSKEFIQYTWPSSSGATVPKYFSMQGGDLSTQGNTGIIVTMGPWPDAAYTMEIIGTVRPASLSSTNTSTFVSANFPALFVMASMIYISGYQRNFSAVSDNPQMAVSYEAQYNALLAGASKEEARKKFSASGWTSLSSSPVATPNRT